MSIVITYLRKGSLLLRNPWFWITIAIIAAGVALTAALDVLYWLAAAFAAATLMLLLLFLAAAYAVKPIETPQINHLPQVSKSKHISIIYDCDLTMGRSFRDVGAGLALLYFLGHPRINPLSVTTTYGNGSVKMTTRTTRRLLNRLGFYEIDILPGAAGPDTSSQENQAAQYLKESVAQSPGQIVIVATGSMTNLKHAAALDSDFFKKLRGLYLMGGTTEPLVWNGHRLAERNFSLDPEAAYQAVHADCPVTIVTGQVGLSAIFRSPQLAALQALGDPVSKLIAHEIRSWFALTRLWFQDGGFGMWDSAAALALTRPDLFESERVHITSTLKDLRTGQLYINPDPNGPVRLMRRVEDFDKFIMDHFAAWKHLSDTGL